MLTLLFISISLFQTALGLIVLIVFLGILLSIKFLLELKGINLIIPSDVLTVLLTILATIGMALYIYNVNKKDREEVERQKQISLLESLFTELNLISSENGDFRKSEGNLQWFSEAIDLGDPLHSIWNINPTPYLSY
ncbi:hypothetical protein IID20_00295, partial [Patescibacteria group bacterium]|nr:hypothetical protein [Patescibacteria group bacterium]